MAFPIDIGSAAQPDTGFSIVIGNDASSMLDFTVPSATIGSVLLIVIARNGAVSCSDASWTQVIDGVGSGTILLDVWARTVDGTTGSNAGDVISFLSLTEQELVGGLSVVTNADVDSVVYDVQHAAFTTDSTPDAPSISIGQDFDTVMVVWVASAAVTLTPPSDFTEIDTYSDSGVSATSILIAERDAGTAGDFFPSSATSSSSVSGRAFSIGIHHLAEPPGSTLAAITAGSVSTKWVVAIEGYDTLLTDAPTNAVIDAWDGTGWTSAMGGLTVRCSINQTIAPWNPFENTGGMLTLSSAVDQFGIDTHIKSGGNETFATASIDCDDTSLTVKSASAFDVSGTIYVGTEAIDYTGKTGTSFTGLTRGQYSPFVTSTGGNFSHPHRIAVEPTTVSLPPVVSSTPRQWHGKWVGLWRHLYDESSGLLNIKEDALCTFAGRIVDVRDNPQTMTTDVEVQHVLEHIRDAVIGENPWTAIVEDGITVAGAGFAYCELTEWTGTAVQSATPLTVVDGTASSLYEIASGRRPIYHVLIDINRWLAKSLSDGEIDGSYNIDWVTDQNGVTHGKVTYVGGGSGHRVAFLTLDATLARALGGFAGAIGGPFSDQTLEFHTFNNSDVHTAVATGPMLRSAGELAQFESQTGELYDQALSAPSGLLGYVPAAASGDEIALCMLNDSKLVLIGYTGPSLSFAKGIDPVTGNQIFDVFDIPWDQPGPTTLRQVYIVQGALKTVLKQIFYSTGTSTFNHPDFDVLPRILGLAIPADLLDAPFELSCDNLPNADQEITILIDRPKKLVDLLGGALKLRFAFLRWLEGGLQFYSWSTPTTGDVLDEANKASPAGNVDEQRSSSTLSDRWARNIIKIDHDRDFTIADGEAQYLSHKTVINRSAIDDAGGKKVTETIQDQTSYASNFLGGSGSLDTTIEQFIAMATLFTGPVRTSKRTIAPTLFEGLSVGDCVIVSDNFARDPDTGERGVAARPGIIVSHSYEEGGSTASGNVEDMHGEVEVMFLDLLRVAPYVPSANVASYTSGTLTIACEQRDYAIAPEDADAVQVGLAGAKIRIVERDPADPASPLQWDRIVASQSGYNIVINSDLTSPSYDAAKSYRVIWDDYPDTVTAQKVFSFQADDADYSVASTRAPYQYTIGTNVRDPVSMDAAPNTAADTVELPPYSSYGDGVGLDVGHQVALNRLVNNLYDYKTASSAPVLFSSAMQVLGDTTHEWQAVLIYPVFLGADGIPSTIRRKLYVAPFWKSSGGATVNARITLSRTLPVETTTAGVVVFPSGSVSKTFTTTSTSYVTAAAQGISYGPIKDLYGVAYLTLELQVPTGSGSETANCYGIATCYQGPRE